MKQLLNYWKHFLQGWRKTTVTETPKNFWQYFIRTPLNWMWTLSSILFIILFLYGWQKYNAPIFYVLALIPFLMLVYNFVIEWNAFKKNSVSGKLMAYLFYGACLLILLIVIGALIF